MNNVKEFIKEKFGSEELFENTVYEIVNLQMQTLKEKISCIDEEEDKLVATLVIHAVLENMYLNHMYRLIGSENLEEKIGKVVSNFKRSADMLNG